MRNYSLDLESTYILSDGVERPVVGFETWQMTNDEQTMKVVENALDGGYRHIDTATDYGNKESVRRAINNSGVPREGLFVTAKLHNNDHTYGKAKVSINERSDFLI